MAAYDYLFCFLEGILTFISPCIIPMIPLYIFYIAGISGDEKGNGRPGTLIQVKNALGFILGFTIVFVLLGAAATSIGYFLKSHIEVFRKISGIIILVFGLYFLGIIKVKALNREIKLNINIKASGFISPVLYGMVFAFGWSPCSGPFLGTALLKAGSRETVTEGMLMLLCYSAGIGIPFLGVAIIYNKIKEAFTFFKLYGDVIKKVSGVLLMAAGILIFTGIM